MKQIFCGFAPVIFEDSEILVLGSFPSIKSRQNNFYYGNPRNRFWKILAVCFDEKLPETIDEKVEICRRNKIALWDVYSSSNLTSSSDNELSKSNNQLSDIDALLKKYKNIKKILCNGALSYNTLIKNFKLNIEVVKMPSTSPACVKFNCEIWHKNLKRS